MSNTEQPKELYNLTDEEFITMAKLVDNNFINNAKVVVKRDQSKVYVTGHSAGGQCINCEVIFCLDYINNQLKSVHTQNEGEGGKYRHVYPPTLKKVLYYIKSLASTPVQREEKAAGFEGNFSDRAKELLAEYKPSITKEQKTPSNMFILGAEAALLKYCPQISEWSKEYSGRTADLNAEEAAVKSAEDAEKWLLDNGLGNLILNDRPTTKVEDRVYASDAMVQYASQFQASRSKGLGMKWIKARDMMPPLEGKFIFRWNMNRNPTVSFQTGIFISNLYVNFDNEVEWLDESAPLSDNSPAEGRVNNHWSIAFKPVLENFQKGIVTEEGVISWIDTLVIRPLAELVPDSEGKPTDAEIEKFILKVMEQDPKKAASWMTVVAGRECVKTNVTEMVIKLDANMPDGKRYDIINTITVREEKKCPYCGCRDVVMFTSDDDECNGCGKYFPAV